MKKSAKQSKKTITIPYDEYLRLTSDNKYYVTIRKEKYESLQEASDICEILDRNEWKNILRKFDSSEPYSLPRLILSGIRDEIDALRIKYNNYKRIATVMSELTPRQFRRWKRKRWNGFYEKYIN